MKSILTTILLLSTTNVFASKLVGLKKLTDPALQSQVEIIKKSEVVTHAAYKKVVVLKAAGKTPQEQRRNTVAQAAHMLCVFFDDGVDIGLDAKSTAGSQSAAKIFVDQNYSNSDEDLEKISAAISSINSSGSVEVYSGQASGNNTFGTVLGIYDIKNNEVAVFASTNCGSDD